MSYKLLQINSVVNSGSTGRIAEEIGQIAIAAGWESYIAYGRHARTSQSELIKIGSDWDIGCMACKRGCLTDMDSLQQLQPGSLWSK